MKIRSRLLALIGYSLLPIAIFGVLAGYLLVEKERETFARGARDRVTAVMTAVDADLKASIAPLEVLARSPSLDTGNLAAFRIEAQRALDSRRGDWLNILLMDASGQHLVNLLLQPGAALPKSTETESVVTAARTLQPVIGQVTPSPVLKSRVFGVRVPVIRDGRAKYVLSAVLEPEVLGRLLDSQRIPAGWAVAIIDGKYRFVSRRPIMEGATDELASPSLRQALETSSEAWMPGRLYDGTEIYRAFRRSAISGWSTSLAIPRSVVYAGALQAMGLFIAGLALAMAIGGGSRGCWRNASRARSLRSRPLPRRSGAGRRSSSRRARPLKRCANYRMRCTSRRWGSASGRSASAGPSRRCAWQTARRTNSWRCWVTSCAIHSRRCRARASC
jgi:hypothetical protein